MPAPRPFIPFPSLALSAAALSLLSACAVDHPSIEPAPAPQAAATPSAEPHHAIHHITPLSGRIISGSVPGSPAAFDQLAAMGVKTIITVDGAAPDVELARARGMRYVHLPVGYHGIDADQQLAIARAVRDLPGPVYIHCHHGKHRGPAAAAAAAVTLGMLSTDEAIAFMKKAGTADHYAGLYACVQEADAATPDQLDAAPADFPEIAPIPGFVAAMTEIDHAFGHLTHVEAAGWAVPADHPDLVPVAEAGRLADLLRVLRDDPETATYPDDFAAIMLASAKAAQDLENAIAAGAPNDELTAKLTYIGTSCKDCHTKHRDNL